jgi:hypothetical protein
VSSGEERNWPETPEPAPVESADRDVEAPVGDTSSEAVGDAYDPPADETS